MIDIDKLIRSANSLPPLPQSVARLSELLARDDVAIREIEEVFAYDGPLTARLLRQANSASSAARTPIGTVSTAVVRLGLGTVMALAVSASTQEQLSRPIPEYGIEEGGLWKHAQAAMLAVEALRKYAKLRTPPEAQTAALLHDMGKAVIAQHLKPDMLELLHRAVSQHGGMDSGAERELLTVNHGELGGLIAQHWKLPDTIVYGVAYHHEPDACTQLEDNGICHIVCLANWIAKAAVDLMNDRQCQVPVPSSAARLGVSDKALQRVVEGTAEALRGLGYTS